MDTRAGVNGRGKSRPAEIRTRNRPARSLNYPGESKLIINAK